MRVQSENTLVIKWRGKDGSVCKRNSQYLIFLQTCFFHTELFYTNLITFPILFLIGKTNTAFIAWEKYCNDNLYSFHLVSIDT